ncbi:MAG TPA: pyrroloquinoline quinone-dependent dehydrogenase [Gammaproteobacteria bacterium]|nr:pyrroloquinoline quinone-dependent dehydrogenase [Gammaproteobacteria bacterium]
MRARCSRAVPMFFSLIAANVVSAQTREGQWPTYGGDLGHTRYAPLEQIDASNFGSLEVAWRFSVANLGPTPETRFQSTPLVVDGVLYTTGGTRRAVTALDAATGEQLWVFSLNEGARGEEAPRQLSGRGLSFWQRGEDKRVVFVTPGYQLVALNAETGRPIASFGDNGIVDLKASLDQGQDWDRKQIGTNSPPTIAGNVIMVPAAHTPLAPPNQAKNVVGYIRGFDVVTGKLLWTFHTVPRKGEPGYETWLNGSAETGGGNAGVWATISADEELGLAYLPVESPYGDMYGGLRRGANLYGESIVAVEIRSGKYRWHYQTSHHPLWDYDIPTAPILVDAVKDGRTIKALAQATKQGLLFVLNRETGEPVWPIPEVAVPQGNVPGEWYSPTQPIPPTRYGHQGVAKEDLIDFTPALRAEAERVIAEHRIGPIYTPAVPYNPNGPISTLMVMGGSNWPGGSFDPDTKMVFVTASVGVNSMTICRYAEGSVMPHGVCTGRDAGAFGGLRNVSVQGLPLLKPPYGTIAAIDLTKGEIAWQIPNGETPENIKNHPALAGVALGRTGRAGQPPGALATKTLLIVAEPGYGPTPDGKRGSMLRAYDKRTGRELGALQLPAPQSGSPMTYLLNDRQYLVIAVSANDYPGELLAYALPQTRPARAAGAE